MQPDSSASADAVRDVQETVRLASWVTVKRTKRLFGDGAYGERGILALTDDKLIFLASGKTRWEIERARIGDVKRPRWAMGSYISFEVNGAFYGVSFGGRGTPSLVSGSDLAIRFGGAAGAGVGVVGDALAVARMTSTAKLARKWQDLLSGSA